MHVNTITYWSLLCKVIPNLQFFCNDNGCKNDLNRSTTEIVCFNRYKCYLYKFSLYDFFIEFFQKLVLFICKCLTTTTLFLKILEYFLKDKPWISHLFSYYHHWTFLIHMIWADAIVRLHSTKSKNSPYLKLKRTIKTTLKAKKENMQCKYHSTNNV